MYDNEALTELHNLIESTLQTMTKDGYDELQRTKVLVVPNADEQFHNEVFSIGYTEIFTRNNFIQYTLKQFIEEDTFDASMNALGMKVTINTKDISPTNMFYISEEDKAICHEIVAELGYDLPGKFASKQTTKAMLLDVPVSIFQILVPTEDYIKLVKNSNIVEGRYTAVILPK